MTDPVPYLMRAAGDPDVPFIARGWAKEMRLAPWSRYVRTGVYMPAQHELIHRLLAGSLSRVACDRDNPDHLLGCVVYDPRDPGDWKNPVLHWLYVKGAYRGLGIARALVFDVFGGKPGRIVCTQASKLFDDSALIERYNVVYSPYLLLGIPLPSPANEAGDAEQATG